MININIQSINIKNVKRKNIYIVIIKIIFNTNTATDMTI